MKIRRLPSGSYNVRIYLGKDESGRKKWKSITDPDKNRLKELARKYDPEEPDQKTAPMLCDAIRTYIDAKTAVLSPYSVRGYENILIVLKRLPVASVACDSGALAMQNIINQLVADGKAPKTVKNYAGLISAAVKYAGYPAPDLTLPQRQKKEPFIPDRKLMEKIMKAAKDTELEVPIALGMMGLRRGEVCAVTADDISGNMLHVSRAAVQIGGKVTTKLPKTYESDRYVQVQAGIAKKILKAGRATDLSPSMLSDRFVAFLRNNGFPAFRFHDLRHFFASYCHNTLKMSDAQIQKLGGWKTDNIMKAVYIQSMDDKKAAAKAASGIGSLFK